MPAGKSRKLKASAQNETLQPPPDALPEGHIITRVIKAIGNNLYQVEQASGESVIAELAPRFRNNVWVKRGSIVIVDTTALAERSNKLGGEISNIATNEKEWRKQSYW